MSKFKHSDSEFTNEETVRRRAWIDRALDSVRGRIQFRDDDVIVTEEPEKPQLYVVKSDDSA